MSKSPYICSHSPILWHDRDCWWGFKLKKQIMAEGVGDAEDYNIPEGVLIIVLVTNLYYLLAQS